MAVDKVALVWGDLFSQPPGQKLRATYEGRLERLDRGLAASRSRLRLRRRGWRPGSRNATTLVRGSGSAPRWSTVRRRRPVGSGCRTAKPRRQT